MWSKNRVSHKSRPVPCALPSAVLVAVLAFTSSVDAEVSQTTRGAAASRPANEKRLMDAERTLLHTLTITDTQPVAEELTKPVAVTKGSVEPKQAALPQRTQSVGPSNSRRAEVKSTPKDASEGPSLPPSITAKIRSLEESNRSMSAELESATQRITLLEQQLDQSRSQLSIAETEVSRLSGVLDSKARASLGKYNVPIPAAPKVDPGHRASVGRHIPGQMNPPAVDVRPPAADADLQVATISVEKADLRLGPGRNHSALMTLGRGSRLMVEARQGEWYRVFAPNGDRAWISSSLVTFGDGASSLNDGSSVRVKGYSANAEEEAFRRVHRAVN